MAKRVTNLTISVGEQTLQAARDVARRQGKSLNAMIRSFLESLAGRLEPEHDPAAELLTLLREHPGNSGGWRFDRSEAYGERL